MSAKITVRLLGQRKFMPMLVAFAFGGFNDNIIKYSLMMLTAFGLLHLSTLPAQYVVSIAANTYAGAIFLFSALGGQMADKWNRTTIMRNAKLFEVLLMIFISLGFFLQNEFILFAGLFLMAAQSAIFAPARLASMPHFLDEEELVPGNALFVGTNSIFVLAGSILGSLAFVTQLADKTYAIRDGAPFLVGSVLVSCALIGWIVIRFLPPSPAPQPDMKINPNFLWETFRLISFVFKKPDVARPVLGIAWFYTMAGAYLVILPTLVRDILGLGTLIVTVFMVIFSVGGVLGAIICGILSHRGNALIFSVVGLGFVALFSVDIWWITSHYVPGIHSTAQEFLNAPENWHLLAAMFLVSIFAGMFQVPLQAMTQFRSDPQLRARTLAGSALMNAAAAILGQFILVITGLLGWGVPSAFLMIGIASTGGTIYMIRAYMRKSF